MFTHPTLLALLAGARHQTDLNPHMPAAWPTRRLLRRTSSGRRTGPPASAVISERRPA